MMVLGSSEPPPTHERILADDEIVEGEVFVRTKLTLGRRSVLRYCTIGSCMAEIDEYPDGEGPRIERCLITAETEIAKLWDLAAGCNQAGHLALP